MQKTLTMRAILINVAISLLAIVGISAAFTGWNCRNVVSMIVLKTGDRNTWIYVTPAHFGFEIWNGMGDFENTPSSRVLWSGKQCSLARFNTSRAREKSNNDFDESLSSAWFRIGEFAYFRSDSTPKNPSSFFKVFVPTWLFVNVLVSPQLLKIMWNIRLKYKQRGRKLNGRCRICGYDLRESKDLCPECGVAIAK